MRNLKYKDIPESYNKLVAPSPTVHRASVGLEDKIKEFYMINVSDLLPYSKQARQYFNDDELNKLAETIKQHGVTTPLSVIKAEEVGKYQVISGERRLRAAKLAGQETVPCIIRHSLNDIEEIALIENIQRSNLHPVELADAYFSLLNDHNHGDQHRLGKKLGVSKSHISETLQYASLPKEIKQYLTKKRLSSRIILRNLIKCKDINEMKTVLGISQDLLLRNQRKTNVLNVYIRAGKINCELLKNKFTDKQKEDIKSQLKKIIDDL